MKVKKLKRKSVKPYFIVSMITEIGRSQYQDTPIRDDPDSNGYPGKILKEGLKHEEIELKIRLVSSGDVSSIETKDVINSMMFLLSKWKIG